MKLLSKERFEPHSYQNLLDTRTFFPPLPEKFYEGLIAEYNALDDIEVSRITYENDGLVITGLLAEPKNIFKASHPLMVYNRGGKGEYGKLTVLSVMRSMVPFAQSGYIVLASNYRGNDGSEGTDEFGSGDVGDVLKLLEIGTQHTGFDGINRFMVGHSRGGMMTYLSLKAGANLNAAVSIAGIADLRGDEGFSKLIPDENKEAGLAARSARAWPEKLKTPLLLFHGTADDKVGDAHSRLLAADLKRTDLPHELEIYEGGNHALVRQWDAVTDRIHDWLERHHA